MKKRKLIAAVLVLALLVGPVVVYSQAVPAVAVWGVSMAGAAWTAASELVLTVRAALAAPAFYSAATWVTSTLAPAASSLAVGMVVTGALVTGAAWVAYMAYYGWTVADGMLMSTGEPVVPEAAAMSCLTNDVVGVYGTKAAAAAACGSGCTKWGIGCFGTTWGSGWALYYKRVDTRDKCYIYSVPDLPIGAVSPETAEEKVRQDLVSPDETKKAKAQDVVKAATTTIINIYNPAKKDGVWPPAAMPGQNPIPQSQWDAWEDALKAGISDTDKTAMGAQDTTANYGLDASNPPIALVGPLDAGLTEEQVKNAVKEGIEEAEDDLQPPDLPGPPPLGTDPDPPDKLSLTAILQDYTDNLETLPIVGIVSGAHLEIEGADPVLDLPVAIPPNPPVNVRIDFSKYESIVDTLGTLMLTYVSIIWTVWLFKGRGDA